MDGRIEYKKGKIIIYPPNSFKNMDNPIVDNPKIFRKFMASVLRSLFVYFKEYAYRRARLRYGVYKCAITGQEVAKKDTDCDHINPIISLDENENDWNGMVTRSLDVDNFQILHKKAHKAKTAKENSKRFKGKKRT